MSSLSLFVLCAALTAFALQSQGQDQHSPAPPSTHESSQSQPAPQPSPPSDETEANRRIRDSVNDLLSSDPGLSGSDVEVEVNDQNIVLTGSVESYTQHQRALQLVSSYGRWRRIVDKLQMK